MTYTGRGSRSGKPPVQKIELQNEIPRWKWILLIILVALALTAFAYGINSALSKESGWTEIEVNSTSEINCGEEFVLMYNLGASGTLATVENKAITNLYSESSMKAYQLFTNDVEYVGINNISYINSHPNEEIEVDEVLYQAFSLIQEYENRNIYLAPIYVQYDDMFYCNDDSEIVYYDPFSNEEVAEDYREIAAFARNPEAIDIQLLGDDKIKLYVSDEYLKYAEENYITCFVDFFWMKNAFIIDYLADVLISNGYTSGSISSYDGFVRNLDESGTEFAFNIYDKVDDTIYYAGVMQYSGSQSIVYLRNYMMNNQDIQHYYQLRNGEVRTSYLDIQDGICKSSLNNLIFHSKESGCAEVLLHMIPIYIADTFQEEALSDLVDKEIYSIYCKDHMIYYNDSSITFTELYDKDQIKYETSLMAK